MTVQRSDFRTQPAPERKTEFIMNERYSAQEMALIRQGFRPRSMEDRWFLYFENDTLHCHRSWTGYHILALRFDIDEIGGAILSGGWVSRDPAQYKSTDIDEDRALARGLIAGHLLHRRS